MTHDSLAFTSVKIVPRGDTQTRDLATPAAAENAIAMQSGDETADNPQCFHDIMAQVETTPDQVSVLVEDIESIPLPDAESAEAPEDQAAEAEPIEASGISSILQPRLVEREIETSEAPPAPTEAQANEEELAPTPDDAEPQVNKKQTSEIMPRVTQSMSATVFAAQIAEPKAEIDKKFEVTIASKIAPRLEQAPPQAEVAPPTQAMPVGELQIKPTKKVKSEITETLGSDISKLSAGMTNKEGVTLNQNLRTALLQQNSAIESKLTDVSSKDADRPTTHGAESTSHGQQVQQTSRATPTTPAPSFADVHRAMGQQTAQQISAAITPIKPGTTDISLSPAELGKLRITVSGNENSMVVTLAAERPETVDLLRRNLDTLSEALRSESNADINFAFAEHEFSNQSEDTGENRESGSNSRSSAPETPTGQASSIVAVTAGRHILSNNLDLRI